MSSEKTIFTPGNKYLVLKSIAELGHTFTEGEIVTFSSSSYDAYHGVTRYWFRKNGGKESNAWHVWDGAPLSVPDWQNYFRPLSW